MSELVPRDYYDPPPVSRQARKQLARVQENALVRRAARDAQAEDELSQIVAQGRNAAQLIHGGYDLADQTVIRATRLNQKVNQCSQDNPGLELTLRSIEDTAGFGARSVILHYMTGR